MIKQPEPEGFNEKVRIPGKNFLRNNSSPNSAIHDRHFRQEKELSGRAVIRSDLCPVTDWTLFNTALSRLSPAASRRV
jgi:hypothetical protein